MRRRHSLSDLNWIAFMAGADRAMSRQMLNEARIARALGDSRESVCGKVRLARKWHRQYLVGLAKALAAQP